MINPVEFLKTAIPCPFVAPYRAQITKVVDLYERQREEMWLHPGQYESFYSSGQAHYVEPLDGWDKVHLDRFNFVQRIESRAALIVEERAKLSDFLRDAMVAKIRQLSSYSRPTEALIGRSIETRAISDFSFFDEWRRSSLDGLDSNMLYTLATRKFSLAAVKTGLFEGLFGHWAKVQNIEIVYAANVVSISESFKDMCDNFELRMAEKTVVDRKPASSESILAPNP